MMSPSKCAGCADYIIPAYTTAARICSQSVFEIARNKFSNVLKLVDFQMRVLGSYPFKAKTPILKVSVLITQGACSHLYLDDAL
ncbi:hypothetical protein A7J57_20540 [Agrobacterium tumefaciens]|uniref:Uncharacterized protein n=1 Tax=Agrobacterium tumefaciens TaxID=358 RepID=A0A176XGL9_AGRTU|nr:hypothetical protein A7J57_20540 [Agrobacterium tumefaciens]